MPPRLKKLKPEVEEHAFAIAVRILTYRDHSMFELRQKLQRRGVTDAVIDDLVPRLQDIGYLDDHRFAEQWVRKRYADGYGPRFIRYELQEKKVATQFIEDVLSQYETLWESKIQALWQKKYQHLPQTQVNYAKSIQYLERRGFAYAAIKQAINSQDTVD